MRIFVYEAYVGKTAYLILPLNHDIDYRLLSSVCDLYKKQAN